MDQIPLVIQESDVAWVVDGVLEIGPSILPLQELAELQLVEINGYHDVLRNYFAFRIPFLPDVTASPDYVSQNDEKRVAEILQNQIRFVQGLSKWKGMAFSLRYYWRPSHGKVEIALVGKVIASPKRAEFVTRETVMDIYVALRNLDFPVEAVANERDLRKLINPHPEHSLVMEVRQREEVAMMYAGEAYVIYPYSFPSTTWISAFRALTNQEESCCISIHLQPTSLYQFERDQLADAASIAATYSEFRQQRLSRPDEIIRDPTAQIVARVYSGLLERLTNPYLVVMQVVSPNHMTARGVAQMFANEATGRPLTEDTIARGSTLNDNFDLVIPSNPDEVWAAHQTLGTLDLHPWGGIDPTPGKERLRYLADANAATCVFRFPIPLRGGIPGIQTKFSMRGYDPGPRIVQMPGDHISIGTMERSGGKVSVPLNQLGRHSLIAGTTGYGKTTTCMHLLHQLWQKSIPFLVIEPTNNQYRCLMDSPMGSRLRVFTLGDESVSPFRLNPLEILPGTRVESHISMLQTCLTASLPTFGVLPILIEQSLHNVYAAKGWTMTDKGRHIENRMMPTLGDLYHEIIKVVDEVGYAENTKRDIRGAAAARIGSLLVGSKGRMLNTRRSISMQSLMSQPTILELESLNDDEKALVMMVLLTMIREYCRNERRQSQLQHVTVIEEAHRVMSAVRPSSDREVSPETRAQAAAMFSSALSEIRAFGEGLIVVEQIPSRLVDDALKNTNTKIVHRILGEDDQRSLANTMNATSGSQRWTLLSHGQAVVFHEGLDAPITVNVPNFRLEHKMAEHFHDDQVEARMRAVGLTRDSSHLPFDGCKYCLRQCEYRDRVTPLVYDIRTENRFRQALRDFEGLHHRGESSRAWNELIKKCLEAVGNGGKYAAFCYFVHLWDGEFNQTLANSVMELFKSE